MNDLLDEKFVGIVAIAAIAIISLFQLSEPTNIVIPCITGIAGFVTGKALEVNKLK